MRRRPSIVLVCAAIAASFLVAAPAADATETTSGGITPTTQKIQVIGDPGRLAAARAARATTEPLPLLIGAETDTRPFEMVGMTWTGTSPNSTVEVRTRHESQWSDWTSLAADDIGADGGTADATAHASRGNVTASSPVFAGTSDGVQARVVGAGAVPSDLTLVLIDPGTSTTNPAIALRTSHAATVGQPVVHSRAEWGADESLRSLNPGCGTPVYMSSAKVGFLHHTDNSNDYSPADVPALIRQIYAYHVIAEGYCDIAYNFLVDQFGGVWEGRYGGIDKAVLGAHSGGFNTDSFGVALIGTYDDTAPTPDSLTALEQIFAWKLGIAYRNPQGTSTLIAAPFEGARYPAGTAVPFDSISGHRDADYTDCPGNVGYDYLPTIRAGTAALLRVGLLTPLAYAGAAGVQIRSGLITAQNWALSIANSVNTVVRTYNGTTSGGLNVLWDERDAQGNQVPNGDYQVTLTSEAGPPSTAIPWTTTITLPTTHSYVPAGVILNANDELRSPNGQYQLVVQGDGNVVEYGNGRALWSTGTWGQSGNFLAMQGDGNLVLYSATGQALWYTNTSDSGDSVRLVLDSDGSLNVNSDYNTRWSNNAPGSDSLVAGGGLLPGENLLSTFRQYLLVMQGDGNLVIYGNGHAVWWSGTAGNPGAQLKLTSAGNLAIVSAASTTLWQTNTSATNPTLLVRPDGNLALYDGPSVVWQSNTVGIDVLTTGGVLYQDQYLRSSSGHDVFFVQGDGNLVVYQDGRALWWTGTRGSGVALVVQGDGNLVLYDGDGTALWYSSTYGTGAGNFLAMQSDGNLVLYAPDRPLWWTGTFH